MNLHQLLQSAFTVEYIMTPRAWLITASEKPSLQHGSRYDVIPRTKAGRIVGLWVVRGDDYEPVAITEEWIVSHSTPIRELIRLFNLVEAKPALLVVNSGGVAGLVSRADLNKLACRTYLYTLISELEHQLGMLIRHHLHSNGGSEEEVLELLCKSSREQAQRAYRRMQSLDVDIGYIDVLSFSDIATLFCAYQELWKRLGFESREQVERDFKGLVHLRNSVAHPVRRMYPIIQVGEVFEKITLVERLLHQMSSFQAEYSD